MGTVGDPGNPSLGVVQTFGGSKGQFVDPPKNSGVYKTCDDAPAAPPPCLTVGAVDYEYGIGKFEVTVSQYVTFLNAVDRDGKNPHERYTDNMSPTVWPQYGSISYSADADAGRHYSVAYPEWADKPFNFGNFRREARFANSLTNGTVLSQDGLGRGERIFAVRFLGDRGYVITLRQTDPLYALDLSDPTRPAVRGELKIPGFSSYLHPVDDATLIGVGQAAGADGRTLGTQVSLFDVSDLAAPRRIAQRALDSDWSEAEFTRARRRCAARWWSAVPCTRSPTAGSWRATSGPSPRTATPSSTEPALYASSAA